MKDFNLRNQDKQLVDKRVSIHAKVGQIWHCKLGVNVGSEENGKGGFLRPVLVLAVIGNMILVVPTTSNTQKNNSRFYYKICSVDFGLREGGSVVESYVMLSQIRTIDSRRLIKHKYTVAHDELQEIKKSLLNFLI